MNNNTIKVIAFDADDTLWDCQGYFDEVEMTYGRLLSDYGTVEEVRAALFAVETANIGLTGFGTKAFTLSLLQNALEMSNYQVDAQTMGKILDLGKTLLELPATPLPEVVETLQVLQRYYRLAVFTKGELLDQENKLRRSGLLRYFDAVKIVSDKTSEQFLDLCKTMLVQPHELMMVGNSFKSDIVPAIQAGTYAVHIPFHVTWQMEHADEFEHERITRISHFGELLDLLQ